MCTIKNSLENSETFESEMGTPLSLSREIKSFPIRASFLTYRLKAEHARITALVCCVFNCSRAVKGAESKDFYVKGACKAALVGINGINGINRYAEALRKVQTQERNDSIGN